MSKFGFTRWIKDLVVSRIFLLDAGKINLVMINLDTYLIQTKDMRGIYMYHQDDNHNHFYLHQELLKRRYFAYTIYE